MSTCSPQSPTETPGLTPEQSNRLSLLRQHLASHEKAWKTYARVDRSGASSATPAEQRLIVAATEGGAFTNALRSELEILEFVANPPARVFAYPSSDLGTITNFHSEVLAHITHLGPKYVGGFSRSTRRTFHAMGINGLLYKGTIFGTYCRMKTKTA